MEARLHRGNPINSLEGRRQHSEFLRVFTMPLKPSTKEANKAVKGATKAAKGAKKAAKSHKASRVEDMKKKHRRKESYLVYIYSVLKLVHPEFGVSSKAMSIMNSFVNDVFERIAAEASRLEHYNKRDTISSREIQTAVRLILPGELANYAVLEGIKAVNADSIKAYSGNMMKKAFYVRFFQHIHIIVERIMKKELEMRWFSTYVPFASKCATSMLIDIARASHIFVTAPFPTGWRYAYLYTALSPRVKAIVHLTARLSERRSRGKVVKQTQDVVRAVQIPTGTKIVAGKSSSSNDAKADEYYGQCRNHMRRRGGFRGNADVGIAWDLYYKTVSKYGPFIWAASTPEMPNRHSRHFVYVQK
ncbi:hypothetical protein KIN20_023870 [Parelaphostrongylus tenuis]|uniref:Core Histone H2A/H2B/H3 domain-containing protein n=1 Tax=Parelaphostrongylus tenuis TaxID=148309 RepID=A0AAD5N7M0_PARTN|nr:hypothetical protein KIN20_023870 [Parelaphostrongylus tenuis]